MGRFFIGTHESDESASKRILSSFAGPDNSGSLETGALSLEWTAILTLAVFVRRDFLKLMISSLKQDETILITTHQIDEIEQVIDRAVILHHGRIKADCYIDEIREQGKSLAELMAEAAGYQEDNFTKVLD